MATKQDYLNALLHQKQTNSQYGGVLVNPSNDLSLEASINTKPNQQAYTVSQADSTSNNASGWQKFMGDLSQVATWLNPVNAGIRFIGNVVTTIGGWAGNKELASTDPGEWWYEKVGKYDPTGYLGGNAFSAWRNIATGGQDDNQAVSNFHDNGDASYQQINKIGTGIGDFLPQVAIAVVTQGASVGVQAAAIAGEAAVNATNANANSVRSALKEGAQLDKANAYGAVNGAISGATTAVFGAVGLSGASGVSGIAGRAGVKAGESAVAHFGVSQGTETLVSKATSIAVKAGIDGARQAALTAADPVIKQFTYDSEAISKAYGSSEAWDSTRKEILASFAAGAVTSAVMQSAGELISYNSDKQGYVSNYENNKDFYKRPLKDQISINKANLRAKQAEQDKADILSATKAFQQKLKDGTVTEIGDNPDGYSNSDEWSTYLKYVNKKMADYKSNISEANSLIGDLDMSPMSSKGELLVGDTYTKDTALAIRSNQQSVENFYNQFKNAKSVNFTVNSNGTATGNGPAATFDFSNDNAGFYTSPDGKTFYLKVDDNAVTASTSTPSEFSNAIASVSNGTLPASVVTANMNGMTLTVPSTVAVEAKQAGIDPKAFSGAVSGTKVEDLSEIDNSDGSKTLVNYKRLDSDGNVFVLDISGNGKVTSETMTQKEALSKYGSEMTESQKSALLNLDSSSSNGIQKTVSMPTEKEANSSAKLIKGFADAYKGKKFDKNEVDSLVTTLKGDVEAEYSKDGDKVTLVMDKNKQTAIDKEFAALTIYDRDSAYKQLDSIIDNSKFQIESVDPFNKEKTYQEISLSDALSGEEIAKLKQSGHDMIDGLINNGGETSQIVQVVTSYRNRLANLYERFKSAKQEGAMVARIINKAKDLRTYVSNAKEPQIYGDIQTDEVRYLKGLVDVLPRSPKNGSLNLKSFAERASVMATQYTPENLADAPAGAEYDPEIAEMLKDFSGFSGRPNISQLEEIHDYLQRVAGIEKLVHSEAMVQVEKDAIPVAQDISVLADMIAKDPTMLSQLSSKFSDIAYLFENPQDFFELLGLGKDSLIYKYTYGAVSDGGDKMYLDRDALTTEKNKLIQETNGDKWNDAKVTWRGHTMTKGEVVDILAANKDPHIKQSMQLGGINRLDRNGNINEAYSDEAISELESLLTPDELKAVDKVFSIYHSKNFTDMLAETNRVNRGFPGTPNPTYYPDTSSKGSKALSVNGDDPITAMLSSGTSVNAIQRVRINPNGFEVMDYRDRLDSWINSMTKNKDMGPALRKCYRILNKKVDLNGRRTSVMKEIRRVYGTRANKMIKTFFEKANEAPRKIGGLTKVTSMGAVGVLAINLPSAFVQPASYFTASNTLGIEPIAKNLIMPSTYSNLKSDDDYLLKNSGYYINHVKDQEYIKATTLKKRLNKIQSAALSLQGLMDRFTNLMTFEACQRYVARMNPSLKVHTDDCRKAALPYYAIALQETQSNAIPWATNDVRYGNAGDLMQGTFGMFAADPQAKASNALKSLRKYLLSFQIRKEAGAKMNDQSYSQEERDRYSNWYKKADEYIKTKGPKETLTYLAALTASGLFAFGVYDFFKRLYGKKEWNDWDPATMTKEAFIQSYVDWVPVVGDIYNAFDTSNSLEPFSLSLVNDTITSIKKIYSAIKSGNVDNIRKACLSGGLNGSQISGLPLKNIYNLAYGILNVTDKSKAIEMKSAFYDVASTASAKMNKAIASGDDKTATAYMNSLMSDRVGTISADEQKEILALLKDGENVLPSGVPDTYKDSNGSEVTISWTDKQSIKRYYAKANEQVSKMIQSSSYSSLTNAQKAYAIRMVYSAYREAGLAKAIPSYAISSKASYLAKAGLNMAFIESAVAYIKGLEATKDKTKKELALAYVNKLSMSKAERLIVLYLCGYAPSDTSSIKSYLSGKGLSSKEINAFLGENKA